MLILLIDLLKKIGEKKGKTPQVFTPSWTWARPEHTKGPGGGDYPYFIDFMWTIIVFWKPTSLK